MTSIQSHPRRTLQWVRLEQEKNAHSPIVVTLFGIDTLVRL